MKIFKYSFDPISDVYCTVKQVSLSTFHDNAELLTLFYDYILTLYRFSAMCDTLPKIIVYYTPWAFFILAVTGIFAHHQDDFIAGASKYEIYPEEIDYEKEEIKKVDKE